MSAANSSSNDVFRRTFSRCSADREAASLPSSSAISRNFLRNALARFSVFTSSPLTDAVAAAGEPLVVVVALLAVVVVEVEAAGLG